MRFLENVIVAAASSLLILPIKTSFGQGMPSPAEIAAQQAKFGALVNQVPATIKPTERLAKSFDKGVQPPKSDPSELARRYAKAEKVKTSTDLMVFVSLTMPSEVLVELSKQAKQHGAIIILRGYVRDSLVKTQAAAQVLNEGGATWQINPDAFKVFKVKSVPSFVLASANASSILEEGCAKPTNFAMVNGNQSFEVALQTIRRKSTNPQIVADANKRLRTAN